MNDVVEIDAHTGAIIERPLTSEELEQREADEAAAAAAQAAQDAAAAATAAATASAIAHAKSLGFTDEMIRVMYPGLITQAP